MNPYDRAAYGFSQAYDMNMRAADEQRRVNRPSTEAFTQELEDERTDLNYSPNPENPAQPSEQYNDDAPEPTENSVIRARAKVAKYGADRG